MASTTMSSSNALTVKLWSLEAFVDMYKKTCFGHMVRSGSLMRADELDNATAGDEITLNYTGILTGTGISEGGRLRGNEEALNNQAFSMALNVVRHGVLSPSEDTIEQQRTRIKFEKTARELLPKWHASRVDASVFNQLAGVNPTSLTVDTTVYSGADRAIVQGLNSINAPTANRIVRAGGAANDESLTSSDTFTLDLIDDAIEKLGRTYPNVEALDGDKFDCFISYEQFTDLKRDTSGKIQWYTNALSMLEGGMVNGNPILEANHYSVKPVGKYANVEIYTSNRVANGVSSATSATISTVRRAVIVGKKAAAIASRFSGAFEDIAETKGNVPFKFITDEDDYGYLKGVEARMIYGVKKMQFENEDNGSIVISTYAAGN